MVETCCKKSSRRILATSSVILSDSAKLSLPTSCTISVRSSSACRICDVLVRMLIKSGSNSWYHDAKARSYLV